MSSTTYDAVPDRQGKSMHFKHSSALANSLNLNWVTAAASGVMDALCGGMW